VEAEIATHKRNWRDGLAFPADISLRINRLDIGIKRFTACSKTFFMKIYLVNDLSSFKYF